MGESKRRREYRLRFPNEPIVQKPIPAAVLIANAERAARKGKFDGNCNRTACQRPIAGFNWFNTATRAYYCPRCADGINEYPVRRGEPPICVAVTDPNDQPPLSWEGRR